MAKNQGSPIEWQVPDEGTGAPEDTQQVRAFVVRPGSLIGDINRLFRMMFRGLWFKGLNADKVDGCDCVDLQVTVNGSSAVESPNVIGGTGITINVSESDITINADNNGDVNGPASSTDGAIPRWNGNDGDTLEDTNVIIGGTGDDIDIPGDITVDGETTHTPSNVDLSANAQEDDYVGFNGMTTAHVTAVNGGGSGTTITGIAGGTEGRRLRIWCIGTGDSLFLEHNDSSGGSADANHILLTNPSDLELADGDHVDLEYVGSRWRQV